MPCLAAWATALVIWSWASLSLLAHAAQDIEGNPALQLSQEVVPIDTPGTFYSEIHPCPTACLGTKPDNWTVYSSVERLMSCNQAMLFDLSIHSPVDQPETTVKLRACTAGDASNANTTTNALFVADGSDSLASKRSIPTCLSAASESKAPVAFGKRGSSTAAVDAVTGALRHLQDYFDAETNCNESIMFAYANGTVAGLYMGPSFEKRTVSSIVAHLMDQVRRDGASETMTALLCGEGRNANHVLGLVVDATGDVASVQRAVRSWANAECLTGLDGMVTWQEDLSLWESNADLKPLSQHVKKHLHLHRRADCTTITVVAGDGCGALTSRCGISPADFTKYNLQSSLCSSLVPGQPVCCSAGTLPDVSPKPNEDGSCASYTVAIGDTCSQLAVSNGLTVKQLEEFNDGTTWGWNGCKRPQDLMAGINICLSKGNPPIPAPNFQCDLWADQARHPTANWHKKLADLNPCPLNACCNIWGQCGVNTEFCIEEKGATGNPGTSPPGTNGCVSSCGVDVVNNAAGPAEYSRIGYYESWNFNRTCLRMRAGRANTDGSYTYIHWAFAEIDTSD